MVRQEIPKKLKVGISIEDSAWWRMARRKEEGNENKKREPGRELAGP